MTAPPLWWDALRPSMQLTDRVDIVTHVPMDARLRNEWLIDIYLDLSEDVAAAIYGLRADAGRVRPNFYSYAVWGAHTVGVQLDRRWWPGRQRRARALESGNARIVNDMGNAATEFLRQLRQPDTEGVPDAREPAAERKERPGGDPPERDDEAADQGGTDADTGGRAGSRTTAGRSEGHLGVSGVALADSFLGEPSCGLGIDILREVSCSPDDPVRDAIEKIRNKGFELYEQARMREDERDQLVLLGNAWLAVSEQALIQDDIAVSARVNVRRWLTPPWVRLFRSQRQWRERHVCGWRLAVEHAVGRWTTRRLLFNHPPGEVEFGGGRSAGALPIHRWYSEARGNDDERWRRLGSPFGIVAEVRRVEYWPCFKQRMAAILVMMYVLHENTWFVPHEVVDDDLPRFRNKHLPKRWKGYSPALARLDRRLRAPLEHR